MRYLAREQCDIYGRKLFGRRGRGWKERMAENLGFTVNFDTSEILAPNGDVVRPLDGPYGDLTFHVFSGVRCSARRFVFHCFNGPIKVTSQIKHIDGDKNNYRIENLKEVLGKDTPKNKALSKISERDRQERNEWERKNLPTPPPPTQRRQRKQSFKKWTASGPLR